MRIAILAIAGSLLIPTAGCEVGPRSGAGLSLPNGDVVAGRVAFSDLGCVTCHTIANEPDEISRDSEDPVIRLGGRVPHIETHGELVTSIVNPSHGFHRGYALEDITTKGDSVMRNFNETMTVQQLIDLTAFLQSKYKLAVNMIYSSEQ